jgi:hypothetical protein
MISQNFKLILCPAPILKLASRPQVPLPVSSPPLVWTLKEFVIKRLEMWLSSIVLSCQRPRTAKKKNTILQKICDKIHIQNVPT